MKIARLAPALLTVLLLVGGPSAASAHIADTQTLTVVLAGDGNGSVESSPSGIACPTTCSFAFPSGATVELTATPSAGSGLAGWSGPCRTTRTGCSVSLTQSATITVTFREVPQDLSVSSFGPGTITSSPSGIDCPPNTSCSGTFAYGQQVTLTATAAAGYAFAGWNGDCSGTGSCTLTMNQTHAAGATFGLPPEPLTVVKVGTGSGRVTSDPAGIDCGTTCTYSFPNGAGVILTATPTARNSFDGWSGPCYTGSGAANTCEVVADAAKTVKARFTEIICDVPDLKPLDLADAKAVLRQQHCTIGKVRKKTSRTVRKGMVISQSPAAGKRLAYDAKVSLVVSSGKPKAKHT